MVTASEMATDARICREAETLVAAGYRVRILCLAGPLEAQVRGAELIERNFQRLPRRARLLAIALWFTAEALFRSADVYHAHNVPALPGCWLGARSRRARLVYDAHEVYSLTVRYPTRAGGSHSWREHLEATVERWFGRGAELLLTASDGYASAIARGLDVEAPIVIANYPPLPARTLASPLRDLAGAEADDLVVLYQGGFFLSSRPLDVLVRSVRLLPENYRLVLLGFAPADEDEQLRSLAVAEEVEHRVAILPPVRHQDLPRYTAGADIGVLPLRLLSDNTRLAAPNKLYEYLQASVPVLSAHTAPLASVLEEAGAGRTYRTESPEAIAEELVAMGSQEELREMGRRGRRIAEERYCWESVEHVFVEAYRQMFADMQ